MIKSFQNNDIHHTTDVASAVTYNQHSEAKVILSNLVLYELLENHDILKI